MSISPGLISLQAGSTEGVVDTTQVLPVSGAKAAARPDASAQPPSLPSNPTASNEVSTNLKIDSQHQLYYEFVDDQTGDVVFQIPPEALREIGESLNLPLVGDGALSSLDVKS